MSIKKWEGDQKQTAIETIINRICEGESLRAIVMYADRNVLPAMGTFFRWLSEDEELREQYARAMEMRAECMFEEIIEISDRDNADVSLNEDGSIRVDGQVVQRSKLMVDSRKWMLGKMQPKKYGDKLDLTTDGEKIQQVTGMIIK